MAQAFDSGAFDSGSFEVTGSSGIKTLAFGITESEVLSAAIDKTSLFKLFAFGIAESEALSVGALKVEDSSGNTHTGWLNPGTTTNHATYPWTNLGNITSSDNTYATATLASVASALGAAHNFAASIPALSTINGVMTRVEAKISAVDAGNSIYVNLAYDAANYFATSNTVSYHASPFITTLTTSDTYYAGGSSSGWANNVWGNFTNDSGTTYTVTPTTAQVNASSFGVLFAAQNGGATTRTISVDHVQMMVFYAPARTYVAFGITEAESHALSTITRVRKHIIPIAEQLANSFSASLNRTISLSILEAESIVNSLVRSRKIAVDLVESIVYSINTLVPPFTLFSFSIAEVETYVLAALRERKIALSMSEIEALSVATLARLKQVQTSVIENEVLALPLNRARTTVFSIAEVETLSSNIVRARKVASSINELENIVIELTKAGLVDFGFTLAEIEALSVAIKRTRNVQSSVAEVIADAMNVVRNRNVAPSIIETQAQATTMVRNRNVVLPLNESLVITSSLARLKLAALSLAETFGYSFSAVKLKALTAAITEIEGFSFGALRRTRNVAEAINEVISFAGSLSRTKLVGLSLNEIEALTETLKRARAVQVALTEVETVSLSLARKKNIATTIAEVESISVNVAKLKMMSYVIQQTEGHSFWLARARKAEFSMNELEAMQASFNRARAYVLPINESKNFSIDFGRLRSQVLAIAETQGLSTALSRVREVLQSISNATGYTFELRKTIGEPNIIRVTVQWQEFVTEGPNQVLKNFSEELISYAKVSSTVNVPAIGTSTVVVPANEVDTLFLGDETTILFVPNNTF